MDLDLSQGRRGELSGEIYRQLRARILDGRLPPGERLPPSRELARNLAVSRSTVVVAYDRLSGEGFLDSKVGAGTFVSDQVMAPSHGLTRPQVTPAVLRPRPLWDDVPVPRTTEPIPDYDFRPGIPDSRQFPYDTWRRLLGQEMHARRIGDGSYGDPAGHRGLRAAIAGHIGVSRGVETRPDDITITNGTQQAVDLITRVLVEPGDQVAVEDPGYLPPVRLFTSLGARVVGVPVDAEGLVVDALPARTRLVYVSPSHQFPLGTTMSLRRRLALLEWARVHDAAIIEDDYDSEFRFDGRPVEPLRTLDTYGRVLYVGSFSKTMLATLRLGYVVAPESVHDAIRAAKFVTDWHTPLQTQAALARFLDDGWFARYVRRMRTVYQERHEQVVTALEKDFRSLLTPIPGSAGLHVTALADTATPKETAAIAARADTMGVGVHTLGRYALGDNPLAGLVLGYGSIESDRIDDGMARLRRAFHLPPR